MAFLKFVRSLFTGAPAPSADLSFGLLEAQGIRPLLELQRWADLEQLAAGLDSDDLTRLVDGISLGHTYAPLLAQYQQEGTLELRRLLAGVHKTFLAWEARGGGVGASLSRQQVDGFKHHLGQAEDYLSPPFAAPSLQAEAAARLVRVYMGLNATEQLEAAFEQSIALQSTHLQAHLFFFNAITPKWFGSIEVMKELVDDAPDQALRNLLQAMYLTERLLELEEEPASEKEAFRHANAGRMQSSLARSPLTADSLYAIYFNNYHACLHHVLGQATTRDRFLQALRGRITAYPWAYFGLTPAAVRYMNTATT